MRIFFSYGHDSNEVLVQQIKSDLEKRGHDVWFDKNEIKGGHDWRRSITEGIVDSDRVLFFMSRHSTRDPGVCLDEISIAIGVKGGNIQTILVESEQEVKPPPSVSYIQWLDMHDWKDQRDAGEAVWEKWYQEKLSEIITVVESDESHRFVGEIRTLQKHLKPISFNSRISQLLKKGFVGRVWLVKAIEQWRNATDSTSRLFWITGAPGVGKSAFVAHLAHYGRDKVIAVQFCEYDKQNHRNAHHIVRTLAFQIATRLPDYRKFLLTLPEITDLDGKDPSEIFDYLLAEPLRRAIDGRRERYLIVIDALDEAGGNGRNELAEMLGRNVSRLPEWIGIVVTSRTEKDIIAPLQGLIPFPLDTVSKDNRDDIRNYLWRELASFLRNYPDAHRLVEQILEISEGVFLYVERFCDDVRHGFLSLDLPDQFPQGLGGIFFQYFQRQFPDLKLFRNVVRPALRAILAAREPLPLEILQRLFHWKDEELLDFTGTLGSLFPVTTDVDHKVIRPYHKSLADWLADEAKAAAYFASVTEGHQMLGEFLFDIAQGYFATTGTLYDSFTQSSVDQFMLKHLIAHLAYTPLRRELEECFRFGILASKKKAGFSSYELYDDLLATLSVFVRDGARSQIINAVRAYHDATSLSEVTLYKFEGFLVWYGMLLATDDNNQIIGNVVRYIEQQAQGIYKARMASEFIIGLGQHRAAQELRQKNRALLQEMAALKGHSTGIDLVAAEAVIDLDEAFERASSHDCQDVPRLRRILQLIARYPSHPAAAGLIRKLVKPDEHSSPRLPVVVLAGMVFSDEKELSRFISEIGLDPWELGASCMASYLADDPAPMFPVLDRIALEQPDIGNDPYRDIQDERWPIGVLFLSWFARDEELQRLKPVLGEVCYGRHPLIGFSVPRSQILVEHIRRLKYSSNLVGMGVPLSALWARLLREDACHEVETISTLYAGNDPSVPDWIDLGQALATAGRIDVSKWLIERLLAVSERGNGHSERRQSLAGGLVHRVKSALFTSSAVVFLISLIGAFLPFIMVYFALRSLSPIAIYTMIYRAAWTRKPAPRRLIGWFEHFNRNQESFLLTSFVPKMKVWGFAFYALCEAGRQDLAIKILHTTPYAEIRPVDILRDFMPGLRIRPSCFDAFIEEFGRYLAHPPMHWQKPPSNAGIWVEFATELKAILRNRSFGYLPSAGIRLIELGQLSLSELVDILLLLQPNDVLVLDKQREIEKLLTCLKMAPDDDHFLHDCSKIKTRVRLSGIDECISMAMQLALLRRPDTFEKVARVVAKWRGFAYARSAS